jgi:hypothetical protein
MSCKDQLTEIYIILDNKQILADQAIYLNLLPRKIKQEYS